MNILEAYIEQFGYLNIIFSSIDYELLKKVVLNLSQDFNAEFLDLFPIMINMEDIDNERVKQLTDTENQVRFIIVPVFPLKYVKLRVSYHINMSLNFKLITDKNIKKDYVELEQKYKDEAMINKYMNLSKYINNDSKLETDIFNVLITRITKKLDNGNYEDRLKTEKSDNKISKEKIKDNKISKEKIKDPEEEFKTEKLVSKKQDQDAKEVYLENKNDPIDQEILTEVADSTIDPFEDINSKMTLDDVNMDDDIEPTNDYSGMEPFEVYNHDQSGGIRKNIIIGKRMIRDRLVVIGSRILK